VFSRERALLVPREMAVDSRVLSGNPVVCPTWWLLGIKSRGWFLPEDALNLTRKSVRYYLSEGAC